MEIKVGEYDVYADGTIVGVPNEPIDFSFDEKSGFVIRIVFINDFTDTTIRVTPEVYKERGALLKFINFNNNLGSSSKSPLKIGTLNNRQLLLNCRVHDTGSDRGKVFHYTWLLGKQV